jgi:hypothetical protein
MSIQPPPLPPQQPPQEKESTFPKQAANACLAAPIILIALSTFLSPLAQNHRDSSGPVLFITMGIVSVLLLSSGVIFGILAIVLARPGQRGSVITRAALGLVLCAVPVALAVPNFVRARDRHESSKQAFANVDEAVKQVREQAVDSLRTGKQQPVSLDGVQKALAEAAQNSSGQDAALMLGTKAYFQRLQTFKQGYEVSAAKLTTAQVLETSHLDRREQLAEREALVKAFLKANADLREFVNKNDENYARELVNAKVPQQGVDLALAAFHRNSAPQVPLILAVRDSNERIANAMIGVLDLLDAQWGHWEMDSTGLKLTFEDAAATKKFNSYLKDIREASVTQAESQKRLAILISQQNPGM